MISSVVFYPKKGVSLCSKGRISIFQMGVSQSLKGRGPKKFSGGIAPGPPYILTPPFRGGWRRRWGDLMPFVPPNFWKSLRSSYQS